MSTATITNWSYFELDYHGQNEGASVIVLTDTKESARCTFGGRNDAGAPLKTHREITALPTALPCGRRSLPRARPRASGTFPGISG